MGNDAKCGTHTGDKGASPNDPVDGLVLGMDTKNVEAAYGKLRNAEMYAFN